MSFTSVHDLKTLVQSMHALITIDSIEEERGDALLIAVAADLDMPYFAWSVTTGSRRIPGGQAIIARDWQLPLLKFDAARLYDKFIGESEKNLTHALELYETFRT